MRICILILLAVLWGNDGIAQSAKTLKRKVAIGRFSNETQYSKSVFYDKENDPMGKQASDILAAKLAASDKFLLIERQDFDKIVAELNTGGGVSQKIGADYLIIGSITEYGRKTIGTQKMFNSSKKQVVEAGVNLRLVDVSTGLVIYSGEAKGEAETVDKRTLGLGTTADFDATLSDKAITAAISKLVEHVINKCMDKEWKAYLLSVEEGSYIISGGKSQGVEEGDVFAIMQKGRKVKNPQTGILVELPGKMVAKIRIDQLFGSTQEEEIAFGTLLEGTIDEKKLENYYITELP